MDFFQKAHKDAIRRREAVRDAPKLLDEVMRLREWIYQHANKLDVGGVHRMGTPQPLSKFADEAREAIGVKRGEAAEFKHPKQMFDDLHRPVLKIPIDSLQYVDLLKEGQAFLMIEKNGKTWVWDGMIMEG